MKGGEIHKFPTDEIDGMIRRAFENNQNRILSLKNRKSIDPQGWLKFRQQKDKLNSKYAEVLGCSREMIILMTEDKASCDNSTN